MEERSRRIVETAIELAEQGGFEAVRLRDVAAHAGVALGTVYKRFKSKEDILVAALTRDADEFEKLMSQHPIPGDSAVQRVGQFFALATTNFLAKPNFARAVLRAVASGEPELTEKVARFHGRVSALINAAINGTPLDPDADDSTADRLAFLLQQIWFANLVGWMGGLSTIEEVIDEMRYATGLLVTD